MTDKEIEIMTNVIVDRTAILNSLITKYKLNNYLEIGVSNGKNFKNIRSINKTGVDPNKTCDEQIYVMTSNAFFKQNTTKFDLIFIDGDHCYEQVMKDINNSRNCLNDNGFIVCHDSNPALEIHARDDGSHSIWNGSGYKAIVELRCTNPNLFVCVVDLDFGCAIITKGEQLCYLDAPVEKCKEWMYFDRNRSKILNLISVKQFIKMFLS